MPSSKEYLNYVLEYLSGLSNITYRTMMGEFIIYYKGKIVGGIYDNRFLIKQTKTAKRLMPDASLELPYDGAKEMLMIDNIDNKEFLENLLKKVYTELPEPKKRKK